MIRDFATLTGDASGLHQRVIGERGMPYVFLSPNVAFFGLFVFVSLMVIRITGF